MRKCRQWHSRLNVHQCTKGETRFLCWKGLLHKVQNKILIKIQLQLPSTSDSKLNYVRSLTVTLTLLTFLHCQIRPSYARLLPAMVSSNYYFLPQIFSPDAASSNEHSLLTGLYYWSSLFEPFCWRPVRFQPLSPWARSSKVKNCPHNTTVVKLFCGLDHFCRSWRWELRPVWCRTRSLDIGLAFSVSVSWWPQQL